MTDLVNQDLCQIELNLEEIKLLKDLLKVETVFQVRVNIEDQNKTLEDKVYRIITFFDSYRILDDQLSQIRNGILSDNPNVNRSSDNFTIVVDRKVMEMYKILCSETTKCTMPPTVKHFAEKYGEILLNKIKTSMDSLNNLKTESEDFKVNILGVVGSA